MSRPIAELEYAKLSEHVEILAGPPFNSAAFTDTLEDIPLVKGENVQQGYVDWSIAKRWPVQDAERYKRYLLVPGDVVVAMDRPWVTAGLKWAYIKQSDPPSLLVQRVARLRGKKTLDQGFLRCLISSDYFSKYIQPIVTGVNVPHISGKQIGAFRIPLLPLANQQKIAAILSAYDDLIANNQRRIKLLERMAEDIYREWFVRLRFPGHEQVKIEKGVPKGWTLVKTEKAFKFYGGATPARDTARFWHDGNVNWFTPTDITGAEGMFLAASGEKCTDEGLRNCSSTLFPSYSVMMTSRATIGAIGINLTPACTNQGFITCIPNEAYPLAYLYHWLKLGKPHFESLSGGSTFAELTKGTFKRMEILTPPQPLVEKFQTLVAPLLKAIETHLKANASLKTTRDALLPRLISGKLAVDGLDIRFPPDSPPASQETLSNP